MITLSGSRPNRAAIHFMNTHLSIFFRTCTVLKIVIESNGMRKNIASRSYR